MIVNFSQEKREGGGRCKIEAKWQQRLDQEPGEYLAWVGIKKDCKVVSFEKTASSQFCIPLLVHGICEDIASPSSFVKRNPEIRHSRFSSKILALSLSFPSGRITKSWNAEGWRELAVRSPLLYQLLKHKGKCPIRTVSDSQSLRK